MLEDLSVPIAQGDDLGIPRPSFGKERVSPLKVFTAYLAFFQLLIVPVASCLFFGCALLGIKISLFVSLYCLVRFHVFSPLGLVFAGILGKEMLPWLDCRFEMKPNTVIYGIVIFFQ